MDATINFGVKNTAFRQKMELEFAEGEEDTIVHDDDMTLEDRDAPIEMPDIYVRQ